MTVSDRAERHCAAPMLPVPLNAQAIASHMFESQASMLECGAGIVPSPGHKRTVSSDSNATTVMAGHFSNDDPDEPRSPNAQLQLADDPCSPRSPARISCPPDFMKSAGFAAAFGVSSVVFLGLLLTPLLFAMVASFKTWLVRAGLEGVVAYSVVFCFSMAALLPYAPFCIGCGYVWGLTNGMLVQTLAILLSSACIYAIGRSSACSAARAGRGCRRWAELRLEIDADWREVRAVA
jgi:hypothetical protein